MVAEADAGSDGAEMAAVDERGAETGELALAGAGEVAEEGFGNQQAEDGVADELELLVVGGGVDGFGDGFGKAGGAAFVGEGAMGQGAEEEFGTAETMLEGRPVCQHIAAGPGAVFFRRVVIRLL